MAKAITVVPPRLLVELFGVPDAVTLPAKVGAEVTFTAHSKRWHLKRVSQDSYHLWAPLSSPRCRWGDAEQIAEDVGNVLETGALPQSKERMC